jgi:cell wall-associated NlpC family hydrolase
MKIPHMFYTISSPRILMPDEVPMLVENALDWTLSKVGSTEYTAKCLGFVEDAYEVSNTIWLDGYASAKEEADAFGVVYSDEIPPRGAFVFYDCVGTLMNTCRNWGHVGLSLGDGRIVHAWDTVRVDTVRGVEELDAGHGWTKPRFLGWAPVSKVLEGYKTTS